MPDDALAPLSVDELADVERAALQLYGRTPDPVWMGADFYVEQVHTILNALPRLLAAAQREQKGVCHGCTHGLTTWDTARQVYVCQACGHDLTKRLEQAP